MHKFLLLNTNYVFHFRGTHGIISNISRRVTAARKGSEFMVILLILAIVCAILTALKAIEGISLSVIVYAVVAVVCLIIYLIGVIQKKRDS